MVPATSHELHNENVTFLYNIIIYQFKQYKDLISTNYESLGKS